MAINNIHLMFKVLPCLFAAMMLITVIPTGDAAGSPSGDSSMAMITFSSDDGYIGVYQQRDIFINRSIPLTCFVITDAVGLVDRMTWDQLNELEDAGWEIGSHGKSHSYLTTVNSTNLYDEVVGSLYALKSNGTDARSFGYPYSDENVTVANLVHQYYYAVRRGGTETTYEAANSDFQSLRMQDFPALPIANDLNLLKSFVDTAVANGDWLHFTFHNITADGKFGASYSFAIADLLDYVVEKIDAGSLSAVNMYDGFKALTSSEDVDTTSLMISGRTTYIDLTEDLYANPELVFKGITLNNTLTNPSFETYSGGTFTGWNFGSGLSTKIQSSSDKYLGSYSGELKFDTTKPSYTWAVSQDIYTSSSDIQPGDKVLAYVYLKNVTNVTKFSPYIEFYDQSNAFISRFGDMNVNSATSWVCYDTGVYQTWQIVPTNAYKIRFRIDIGAISSGATDATYRIDGAVLMKVPDSFPPLANRGTPFFLEPPFPFVGSCNTTNPSVVVDGVTYSYTGTLADGEEARFNLSSGAPYAGMVDMVPTVQGHGLVLASIEGNRMASVLHGKISPSPISDDHIRLYEYSSATKLVIWNASMIMMDSPASVSAYAELDDGTYYVKNGDDYNGPYLASNGFALVVLAPGTNLIITESDYHTEQMDAAISPIFAIIPLVIIMSVIPMVMGLGRKLH